MSFLQSIQIQGIRSFNPAVAERLNFDCPVTVLIGKNGSGKTTIIEALRYITSGDMPAGSKGAAFVHDPKVSDAVDVKGQIKLKVSNGKDDVVVLTRSILATQKKNKTEFKTLEGVVQIKPKIGEPASLSGKCVDLEREACNALGVSKAVINNVIFCHQEDSTWPLSEGKVLKARFDDIFNATAYIKATDSMRTLQRSQAAEISNLKTEIKFYKDDKDEAARMKIEIKDLNDQLAEGERLVKYLSEQMEPMEKQMNDIVEKEKEYNTLKSEYDSRKLEKQFHLSAITDITSKITRPYDGTIADLRKELENFESLCRSKKSERTKLEKLAEDLDSKIKRDNELKNAYHLEKVKAKSELKYHKLQLEMNAQKTNQLRKELEEMQEEYSSKSEQSCELFTKHKDVLDQQFKNIAPTDLRHQVDVRLQKIKSTLRDQDEKMRQFHNEMNRNEEARSSLQLQISSKESELKQYDERILKVSIADNDDLDKTVVSLSSKLEKLRFEKGKIVGSEFLYKDYVERLKKKNGCPLCKRNFENEKDAKCLLNEVEMCLTNLPDDMERLNRDINTEEKKLRDLHQLQPTVQLANKLKSQDIPRLNDELNNLIKRYKKLKAEENENDEKLSKLRSDCSNLEKLMIDVLSIDKLAKELERIETRKYDVTTKLNSLDDQLLNQSETVERQIEEKSARHNAKLDQHIVDLERRLTSLIESQTSNNRSLRELCVELDEQETHRRNLCDNLEILQKRSQIRALDVNIDQLGEKIETLKSGGSGLDATDLRKEYSRLTRKYSEAQGRLNEQRIQLNKLSLQANTDKYKLAGKLYAEKFTNLHVIRRAVDDLKKFEIAVEKCLLAFHQEKMMEINEIVKNLWQKIYKGDDIDYIQIRAEEAESTDRRRAYNYRVTMTVNDVELDMRGRCSAGQKMLASIVIRVALAEVFCAQCGILALDEPTTNLDSSNMQALAEALTELIHQRASQKNFQLILITHEIAFVDILARHHAFERAYHVFKDANGYSRLKAERGKFC